ncbi:hypothetical protein CCACVL1_28846 [Corchorus capsularis]|uniref:J domain-containing protein n=1 Tax=Corchorus capsularis TaxID=210143 RepID=A0A1R3G507_COCAP|nr:hypothetical protein CCACVL1_28846 [Corchorus capsularis]
MASEKRCLYEVLGLSRDCTQDEIRSAYKKLALQRHPDKLVQSGISQADATAQFQELVHAYEVLSDPKERSWYDSHRSQILFADRNATSNSPIPDLFSFFSNTVYSGYSDTGRGFYKVYSDLFSKIYANELNFAKRLGLGLDMVKEAPLMGNLESPYSQVTAFYNYWLGFSTVMDFVWVDEYDVMAGPNRKSRRVMEEENKKLRRKAKREYNETEDGFFDVEEGGEDRVEVDSDDNSDEEDSVLEAMVSGKRNKKNAFFKNEDVVSQPEFHVKDESDDGEFMEYDNRKNRRKNRRAKNDRGKKNGSEAVKSDANELESKNEEASLKDTLHVEEQPADDGNIGENDDKLGNSEKMSKQSVDRKGNSKKETNTKSSSSSKGKKSKATAKHSGNVCETCGEEFQSKNKLHKHLGDTGHASLKYR